ncbi:ATP-binding protein [Polaribacter cellanae]|uniref:ATP-binding protein n=1 Tax=Polaribacter cellanae TaxID=2818493 RepID=A0A975CLR0_9FLAO|nr:ATP-binding protein [Polaribacter cellanae]QTE21634.1 ATP-binding protein [Polaribacter cellanae]
MIQREITKTLLEVSKYYSVITITGPRQSGKTTLIKSVFSYLPYILLENPETKKRVIDDPIGFLENYPKGAILDEVQNVPELFSYIQGIVDDNKDIFFVLSGSQNFLLLDKIKQTLAGRTAIIKLLPFSNQELKNTNYWKNKPLEFVYKGMYPSIYDRNIPPNIFYSNYIQTYVERDVSSIRNIGNLTSFTNFLSLCAGRVGQILNIDSLATDAGIAPNTAKDWLSILEASYIIHLLKPHYKNFNKRLVKRPKLYFYDTGLACNLLQIKSREELQIHFAKGNLFENYIINELLKNKLNRGEKSNLYFWRDKHGKEIDCIVEKANSLIPIEIKSSVTYQKEHFKNITYWNKLAENSKENSFLVYAGNNDDVLPYGNLTSWKNLNKIDLN